MIKEITIVIVGLLGVILAYPAELIPSVQIYQPEQMDNSDALETAETANARFFGGGNGGHGLLGHGNLGFGGLGSGSFNRGGGLFGSGYSGWRQQGGWLGHSTSGWRHRGR